MALVGTATGDLGGSEYLKVVHGKTAGKPPRLDVDRLNAVHELVLALGKANVLHSAHDVSSGGLAAALVECCVSGPELVGFVGSVGSEESLTPQEILFGEEPGRFVVSYFHEHAEHVKSVVARHRAPMVVLGSTVDDAFSVRFGKQRLEIDLPLAPSRGVAQRVPQVV